MHSWACQFTLKPHVLLNTNSILRKLTHCGDSSVRYSLWVLKKMFQKMFSAVTVLPNFMLTLNIRFKRTSMEHFHARVVHVRHNKHPQQPVGRRSVLFYFAANYNLGYVKPTQAMLSLASNDVHSFVFVVYWHGVRRWGSEGPGGRKRRLAYTDVNLQPARLINKEQQDNTHRRRVALCRQFCV